MKQRYLADKELQAHYDEMFSMFASPGWAALMEKVGDLLEELNIDLATPETLQSMKGERKNLLWLRDMPLIHERAHASLVEADSEDEADAVWADAQAGVAKVVS